MSFWIHAVSVGEVKAAQPLFRALKKLYPDTFFLITTTTATGQAEASRLLSDADLITYCPRDFPWTVRRFVEQFRPKLFLLIETDVWPNLLRAIRKGGGKTALVSGKLSSYSAKRFRLFAPLSKKLFSQLDLLCVQNEEHARRFAPLVADPTRLHITGNLKLDLEPEPVDVDFWREKFALSKPAIAITCTHAGEEEAILEQLLDLDLFFFLAPRHPERFEEVAGLLSRKKIPFTRWNQPAKPTKVLLVDAMGKLPICYSLSRLSIIGGSFTGHVGGHNILEPCLYGIPVFFGPSMGSQREFVERVLEAGAGRQVSLEKLREAVEKFFLEEPALRRGTQRVLEAGRGSVQRTLEKILASIGSPAQSRREPPPPSCEA